MNLRKKKIYIAGHGGMVGSAITGLLKKSGFSEGSFGENLLIRTLDELDLRNQQKVSEFFSKEKPDIVIIAAAKVGGILANNIYRAEFIYDNLMIESNLIHASFENDVEKLIFLGSSCIYPKLAQQPLREEYLLSGYLEYTNEPYAVAKIAGVKLCENYYLQYGCNFFSVMPTNLYGPNDNFDLKSSHVLPALLRKFHEAKEDGKQKVTVWGTGKPMREFLYVEDLADAILFLLEKIEAKDIYEQGITHINIGTGKDITIAELARIISDVTGFKGEIEYDSSKPDGTPRKLMDVSRMTSLGWKYSVSLKEGIENTYNWFKENVRV